jgi:hypothetical protein
MMSLAQTEADPTDTNHIAHFAAKMINKVGVVRAIEKRFEIMQMMQPLMDGIINQMHAAIN